MRIDLHAHTTASDGTTLPSELATEAVAAGVDVVAITDHDTTAGWHEAAEALPAGLSLVRGAELSCRIDDTSIHVLAYLFDPDDAGLQERFAAVRASRDTRGRRMVELLQADGYDVSWDAVAAVATGTIGRPHVAQAMVEAGVIAVREEAFSQDWIGTGGRYWAGKQEMDAVEAVRAVTAAGGVTVFAHPAASKRGEVVDDSAIVALAAAGLTGLEVDHTDHSPEERAHLRGLAADLGLVVTGSSDYHGERKAVRLGEHTTAPDQLAEIVGLATGVPLLGPATALLR